MSDGERKLVVIGSGVAGATAALAARAETPDAEVVVYSIERHPFYNKIALGSVITGARRPEHLAVLAPDWLESHGVEHRRGESVRALDPDRGRALLETGADVSFDRLILATGASPTLPPVPGIDGPGVFPLWSLDDALTIRDGVRGARRIVVIGGGVLGVEAAFDLSAIGVEVTLVEARPTLMPDLLDAQAARLLADALAARGVRVLADSPVTGVSHGVGRCRIELGRGAALDVDVAILVAGVAPNVGLARSAGLRTGRGILVDEHQRTSHPRVLAAGNCTEPATGVAFLWNPARRQGEVAGINAFEVKRAFEPFPPTLHTKTPGFPVFVCGRTTRSEPGDRVLSSLRGESYRALRVDREHRLVGAICAGDVGGYPALERAIVRGEAVPVRLRGEGSADAVVEALAPPVERGERTGPTPWVCRMCGYTPEGEHPPEVCPVCGVGRDQFVAA
jgi:nitrite reductase (NADH) large subunit